MKLLIPSYLFSPDSARIADSPGACSGAICRGRVFRFGTRERQDMGAFSDTAAIECA